MKRQSGIVCIIACAVLLGAPIVSPTFAQPAAEVPQPQSFGGIGAMLNAGDAGGAIIAGVMPGGPAEKAGVEPGDRIMAVDGVDVSGMELGGIVERVRGREGAPVTLTLQREGEDATFDVSITRERIDAGAGFGGPTPRYAPWGQGGDGYEFWPPYSGGPQGMPGPGGPRQYRYDGGFPPQMPMAPPQQPIMTIENGKIYILSGNVLYKFNAETLEQMGSAFLVPPRPDGG
jgi:hypothetical protein